MHRLYDYCWGESIESPMALDVCEYYDDGIIENSPKAMQGYINSQPGLAAVLTFGSQATGVAKSGGDVDIDVLSEDLVLSSPMQLLDIREALSNRMMSLPIDTYMTEQQCERIALDVNEVGCSGVSQPPY